MNKTDLSQAVKNFQIQPLSRVQVFALIHDRAQLIKPLLKQSTLERLGTLSAFFEEQAMAPRIWDQKLELSKRMLNIQTEGIFGASYPNLYFHKMPLHIPLISKFWGLCRDSQWCYGEISFIKKGECEVDVSSMDFYHLELEKLLKLWPDWIAILNRLGKFVLTDMDRVEKRYQLIKDMATRIEIENLLVRNSIPPA
ncbi:MAG: hypothetical protein ACD_5C00182G0001 [uncultured bacterium]|nr:MAG: hypothetical protein ACD_5C00182G0001 [uncultured bacterium]KKQ59870.1 MAG: hypothetical protein US82_C0049G0007 [Parcubacteria group bacterium GW2011_GWC1_38_22]